MDDKALKTLEYDKILDRLAKHCAFPASVELALTLHPTSDIDEARRWQAETAEAVSLLATHADLSIGGARDVRTLVDLARHGGVLSPGELLDVKYTLVAARTLARTFERLTTSYPVLADIASQLLIVPGVIDAITRAISERGEILDSASVKLGQIRHDLRIAHDRLMSRLQRMVSDPNNSQYLQEALITQRDGRYVIPLRSEFKGRIKSIVHDQSASGATLFVEPIAVVELNNEFRELILAERDEERRILAELASQIATQGDSILHTVEVIARIDLALARARYAFELKASIPVLHALDGNQSKSGKSQSPPRESSKTHHHPGCLIRLYQARHPLLDPIAVVPIDVELDDQTYALVITGPNTGGKTVTLKTIGLICLMAQSGLHIPAHSGSEISLFQSIFADIGDEQSIEQSLSTFSGHITNIIRILAKADARTLVILDELGAGTDPQEGAALARALLSHLLNRGITTLVTTHHPELKAFAHATPGVVNASVEFDLETLRPTFHLTIGLPGRSNALAIAEKLGLPLPIIQDARAELNPNDLRAEDLLDEIHHQRELSRQARLAADKSYHEAEELRRELVLRFEKIETERQQILETTRLEAEQQLNELQDEISQTRRKLARAQQPLEVLQEIENQIEELQEHVELPIERQEPALGPVASRMDKERRRPIRLGDKVHLRSLGTPGVVIALSDNEAEVQVGVLRVRTRLVELELERLTGQDISQPAGKKTKKIQEIPLPTSTPSHAGELLPASPGLELDLRGQRAEDALDALERYLDQASLVGLPFVRIIHGKGTGRLRDVVRQSLKENPHVKSFESGGDKEGGEGVTVAKLH